MEEAPADPFGPWRDEGEGAYLGTFGGERMPVLLRWRDVRLAARDWGRFSSDAPGRVPIPEETDVRAFRQLPIETDPPEHGRWRDLVRGFFRRPAEDPAYAPRIAGIVDALLDRAMAAPQVEATLEIALPLQSRALAVLLGLPGAEAEEWTRWGLHAFQSEGRNDPGRAAALDRTIARHVARALADPAGDDLFAHLARARIDGRALTAEEITGIAHVTFAGGRDTVIHTLAEALDHLARHPADLARLRAEPALLGPATEEVLRHASALTYIGRVCTRDDAVAGHPRRAGERVALCWGAANFDPAMFEAATELRLDRHPNPHVAFGSGDHNCLGSTHARLVVRTLLARIAARVGSLAVLERRPAAKSIGGVLRRQGFDRLLLRLSP